MKEQEQLSATKTLHHLWDGFTPLSQQGAALGRVGRGCNTWARPVAGQPALRQAAEVGGAAWPKCCLVRPPCPAEPSCRCAQTCRHQVSMSGLGGDGTDVTSGSWFFPTLSSEECEDSDKATSEGLCQSTALGLIKSLGCPAPFPPRSGWPCLSPGRLHLEPLEAPVGGSYPPTC